MKAYDDICKTFGFLSELTSLNFEKIEDKAKNLVSSYPDDLKDILADTICCIYAHSETCDCERISMYRLLHGYKWLVVSRAIKAPWPG